MAIYLSGNVSEGQKAGAEILSKDLGYKYPKGLDLRPSSKLHKKIVSEVLNRAQASYNIMSRYKPRWREIDKVLRVYMTPEAAEGKKKKEQDKYADLVIPESYAAQETILTYYMASFMQDPMIKYEGSSPKDVVGAKLLTHLIDHQVKQARMGLNIHTMLRDDTAYGFGAIAPTWRRYYGKRPRLRQFGNINPETGIFEITREEKYIESNVLLYEGNELQNINPYLYLPDVSVPIHEPHKGSYQGWVEENTLSNLLYIEADPKSHVFNVRYLKELDNRSQFSSGDKQETRHSNVGEGPKENNSADVVWMYVDLIPSDWELGESDYPEKWLFGVTGDQVVIVADKVDFMHERIPVVVSASNTDGYSATPVSKLSMIQDTQTLINFMYTSYIQEVRKSLNGMYIVDPSIINYYDLLDPKPGKVIRTRRAAWGNQMLDQAFKQLDVNPVARDNIISADHLSGIMRRISSTSDNMQGGFANRTSRISAREAGASIGASLSRYEKNAQMIDMQAMQPLAIMLASHTQQYMERETYVKVTGDWPEQYKMDFADQDGRIPVHPLDLMVEYDVNPTNGKIPGTEDPQQWTQLFQIAATNPVIAQQLDWIKMFKHIARNLGASNVNEFIVEASPDQKVLQQVQQGNLVSEDDVA